uniref:Importin subunit alpha n=1 Tax=Neobodo designis TaxID=312471 RepID=A0A7S1W0F2_NEODS
MPSVNETPPIQAVVDSGVVPRLVSLLPRDDWVELQFEAAWAVSNVASGTQQHTHLVIQLEAVPQFVRLLESPSEEVREQATWAIGNIAGDSADCRNYILSLGAMPLLIKAIGIPVSKVTILRNAVWALSNLCRSKPPPPLDAVAPALPVLAGLLNHHDKEVMTDACWAISYISDGPIERIQRVLQSNVIDKVISMLTAPSVAMQTPALRTIGNVVTGNDVQTQVIIDHGALAAFHFLLNHPRRAIKKEACWCLSNITAGSVDQIQSVIGADLYPVVKNLLDAPEYEVKKEAVWCIANTTSGGTKEQLRYLVDIGILDPLCRILTLYDLKIVTVALEAIENFLQLGQDDMKERCLSQNPYSAMLVTNGGYELIEALQEHSSPELYNQSVSVIETYFDFEEQQRGAAQQAAQQQQGAEQQQAQQQQQGGYNFGGQQQQQQQQGGGAWGNGNGNAGGGGYNFAGAFGGN